MHIYTIPEKLSCIIFDIDSTLYTHAEYALEQVDIQIRHFAKLRNIAAEEARELIGAFRRAQEKETGKKISLGNTLTHFGIPITESIKWRENLIEPALFLCKDPLLISTLEILASNYTLIAVTNNPVLPAKKTLDVLGVSHFFLALIGLDTTGVSKPHELPFMEATKKAETTAAQCLSVGDRYDIDIDLPLKLGMGGILVDGVEDVYRLPEILSKYKGNRLESFILIQAPGIL